MGKLTICVVYIGFNILFLFFIHASWDDETYNYNNESETTELITYQPVRNDFNFNSTYLNETVSYFYSATKNYRLFVHANKTRDWEPEIDIRIDFYDANLDFM